MAPKGIKQRMNRIIGLLLLLSFSEAYSEEYPDCENAWTSLDINKCMHIELSKAEEEMQRYLNKSLERYKEDDVSIESIKNGQTAWEQYRDTHCSALFSIWRSGTIRTAMRLGCKIELTHTRTKVLWTSFLTYVDSTPALLPMPQPYKPKEY